MKRARKENFCHQIEGGAQAWGEHFDDKKRKKIIIGILIEFAGFGEKRAQNWLFRNQVGN